MDTEKINEILHRDKIQHHYHIPVGDGVVVVGPRVPMTRYTEFVSVEPEKAGDVENFRVDKSSWSDEEGLLSPQEINVQSIGPGTLRINFVAKDSLTGKTIPGVEPVGITIEALPDW